MSDADVQSRLTVTTKTGGSEYYDQVLAMSAHIVNNGWEQLWETYEDPQDEKITLKRIDIENDDLGYIHAETLPCRITFEGTNHSGLSVYYFIRFKSGTLQNAKGTLPKGLDMTGWCICVNVKIGEQKKSEMTKEQIKYIEDNYSVPGDYSIARLFADLTSAYFDSLDADRSTFGTGEDGKPITYDQWLDQYDEDYSTSFYAFMSTWKRTMKSKGYSTLGVKVVIPSMQEQDPLDPTYPPTAMLHQGFQYKNDQTDKTTAADYNCLLYCEQLMNRDLPQQSFIADGGNWCYPEYQSNPAVQGTFAISSQIFFERVNGLREHMRPLAALSEISLQDVTIFDWGGRQHLFDVGHNPAHEDPNDNYFLAKKDDQNHRYIWTRTWTKNKGTMEDIYYYCTHTSVQSVTIGWEPGSSRINVAGKTTYSYESSDWTNATMTERQAILSESYTASWEAPILMSTDDEGRLTLKLEKEPQDTKVSMVQDYSTEDPPGAWSRQNTPDGYEHDIETALQSALVTVEANLALIFQTTGQWVYPGNGVLYYRNPMFNNTGDVLAVAEYKSLTSKAEVPGPHPGATLSKYPKTKPNVKVLSSKRDE
ncbi:hypothetical protein SAMD00023353_3101260 [Rosellinia necatrix]|uniref:Uncharacterized protein n=1 Tax=Rosellinia necatrix TaxID=77044 RepID=A0A1W2TSK2_ROSNE|nr:hypothetical protein SAMD00023353_3101260 [Rosellinia necatrix]